MNPSTDSGATEFLANLNIGTVVTFALVLTILRIVLLRFAGTAQATPSVPEANSFFRGLAEIFESLIIAGILVFLIIRPFFVQAFFIPSESMENTLLGHDEGTNQITGETHDDTVHDHIFVNKMIFRLTEPKFKDIIVFRAPLVADQEDKQKGLPPKENILIKRLMGLPGDTIEVRDGKLIRNNVVLNEPYIKEPISEIQDSRAIYGVGQPLKLGPNQLFVMGDNRNNSNDSRFWGTLDRSRVIGKASCIFWPMKRIRILH